MLSGRWTRAVALGLTLTAGCAGRGSVDLLEARLREQQSTVAELQARLESTRQELNVARRETETLRRQVGTDGVPGMLAEQTSVAARATGISLDTRLTGGLDRDGRPGDEILNVLFAPHDHEGQLVKLPGTIEAALFDAVGGDVGREIGRWTYGIEESRELWHAGFIGSGYKLELPCEFPLSSEKVMLYVKFTSPDGREFEDSGLFAMNCSDVPATAATTAATTASDRVTIPESAADADDGLPPDDPDYHLDAFSGPNVREFRQRAVAPPLTSASPDGFSNSERPDAAPSSDATTVTSDTWTEGSFPYRR